MEEKDEIKTSLSYSRFSLFKGTELEKNLFFLLLVTFAIHLSEMVPLQAISHW
jgi:hypothetical protein